MQTRGRQRYRTARPFCFRICPPQAPRFNRDIWKDLEEEIRKLDKKKRILETYVICGPIFYFDKPVSMYRYKRQERCIHSCPSRIFQVSINREQRRLPAHVVICDCQ
ncbi:MAG: hypothetical protein GY797_21075 [Deltaproteobacteria bacterium]|nr:hypothetical protein [Deltaproteobacteria bacterium]